MSSAFNISSDISESYRAMYREHVVYVRLEKNVHCSFVFKEIVNLRAVGTVVLVFLQNSFYITRKNHYSFHTILFSDYSVILFMK